MGLPTLTKATSQPAVIASPADDPADTSTSASDICNSHDKNNNSPTLHEYLASGEDRSTVLSRICALSNETHSLFSRAKTMHNPTWKPELYADLKPAWKLASRIITHDSQLPYWDAVMSAAADREANMDADQDLIKYPTFTSEDTLSPVCAAEVREFLNHLADRVQFFVDDLDGERNAFYEQVALDSSEDFQRLFPDAAATAGQYCSLGGKDNFIGSITLDKAVVDDVRNWDAVGRTIEETRLKSVHLAVMINHELSYLAFDFLTGHETWWFNDELASETGLAYKNFIFSGLVRQDTEKQRLYLESWPSYEI